MYRFAYAAVMCAPLLALGFGAVPAAWAAPVVTHGATVSIGGDPKHTSAGTTAQSTVGNLAIAVNGGQAVAVDGTGNTAIAVNGSHAEIGFPGCDRNACDGNTAIAINNSTADIGFPACDDNGCDNNTAKAVNGSTVEIGGDNTRATVICRVSVGPGTISDTGGGRGGFCH